MSEVPCGVGLSWLSMTVEGALLPLPRGIPCYLSVRAYSGAVFGGQARSCEREVTLYSLLLADCMGASHIKKSPPTENHPGAMRTGLRYHWHGALTPPPKVFSYEAGLVREDCRVQG